MNSSSTVKWGTALLCDVCLIDKTKHNGDAAPYVGLEDISNNTGKFLGSFEPKVMKSSTFLFDERHILYGRLRPYLNKAFTPNFEGHCSSEIFPLMPSSDLDRRYLFYWLTSNSVCKFIDSTSTGARMPRANMNEVMRFKVPLPPLEEQRRIVAVLDEAFEGLDRARTHAAANLLDAQELFKSYLWVTFNDETISWIESELADLGVIQTGSTPKTSEPDNLGNFIPFIKPGDFRDDGSIIYDNQGLSEKGASVSRFVPVGSALMVCIGATIGKSGFTKKEITTNQQINSLSPRNDILGEYLYYQMITPEFQATVLGNAGQATLPIINKSKWSRLRIKLPSDPEMQRVITDRLRDLRRSLDQAQTQYRDQLSCLDDLRQSLLQRAFAGELT